MKKSSLSIFAFVLSGCFIISCSRKDNAVVNTNDYSLGGIKDSGETKRNMLESKLFWKAKVDQTKYDLSALMKLASVEASLFKVIGNITNLNNSDSLLQIVKNNSAMDQAGPYQLLALNAMTRHEFWTAKKYISHALKIGDKKSSSLYTLSDIHFELGNADSAKLILDNFTNKRSFAWLIRKAKLMDHDGDLDSAIVLMETALQKVDGNKEMFCWTLSNLGDMYGHAGKIKKSYQAYLTVLRRDPDYDYALKGIAWIAFSHDRNAREASRILTYLSDKKMSPDYLFMLAQIAEFEKNFPAMNYFKERFRHEAGTQKFGKMYNRYLVLMEADDSQSVVGAYEKAKDEVRMRPTIASYDLLAWTLFRQNKIDEALETVETFVEGQNTEPQTFFHIGMIYLAAGKIEKGKSCLKRALEGSFELGPRITEEIKTKLNG